MAVGVAAGAMVGLVEKERGVLGDTGNSRTCAVFRAFAFGVGRE